MVNVYNILFELEELTEYLKEKSAYFNSHLKMYRPAT